LNLLFNIAKALPPFLGATSSRIVQGSGGLKGGRSICRHISTGIGCGAIDQKKPHRVGIGVDNTETNMCTGTSTRPVGASTLRSAVSRWLTLAWVPPQSLSDAHPTKFLQP